MKGIKNFDEENLRLTSEEKTGQNRNLRFIVSDKSVLPVVLETISPCFTNKLKEAYPGKIINNKKYGYIIQGGTKFDGKYSPLSRFDYYGLPNQPFPSFAFFSDRMH